MSRFKAAGLHLLISALVFAVFLAITRWLWFPGPLFAALDIAGLLILLTSVDVIIGPLLTLAVFKSGKPSLKFDLTVIALLQLAALAYGAWVTWSARPVYIVFSGARYELVREIEIVNRDGANPEFMRSSWTGPQYVYAEPPSGEEGTDLMMSAATGGADVYNYPKYYQSLALKLEVLRQQSDSLETFAAQGASQKRWADLLIARHGGDASTSRVVALKIGNRRCHALIDPATGTLQAIVGLDE